MKERAVFSTPWFKLIEKSPEDAGEPHYAIRTSDYVHVVAMTPKKDFILVRQFRPAVGRFTLELPGGHVDAGQTPEEAAQRELLEETGCSAKRWTFLGKMATDVGRMENYIWCYLAEDVTEDPSHEREPGVEVVRHQGSLSTLLDEKDFCSALNCLPLLLALRQGALTFAQGTSLS